MARYLALGDSYSIGEGVDGGQAWPRQLAPRLAARADPPLTVEVIARTGWSTDELLQALDAADPRPPWDLVSVLVGVNDQYRDRAVDQHLPFYGTLLTRAVALADGDPARVLSVSIPDWGGTGFGADDARGGEAIAAAIDAYNAAQRALCATRGIAHVDITGLSRQLAGDPAMTVADRLHPSAAQYRRWLDLIEPVARRCLDAARLPPTP